MLESSHNEIITDKGKVCTRSFGLVYLQYNGKHIIDALISLQRCI